MTKSKAVQRSEALAKMESIIARCITKSTIYSLHYDNESAPLSVRIKNDMSRVAILPGHWTYTIVTSKGFAEFRHYTRTTMRNWCLTQRSLPSQYCEIFSRFDSRTPDNQVRAKYYYEIARHLTPVGQPQIIAELAANFGEDIPVLWPGFIPRGSVRDKDRHVVCLWEELLGKYSQAVSDDPAQMLISRVADCAVLHRGGDYTYEQSEGLHMQGIDPKETYLKLMRIFTGAQMDELSLLAQKL